MLTARSSLLDLEITTGTLKISYLGLSGCINDPHCSSYCPPVAGV